MNLHQDFKMVKQSPDNGLLLPKRFNILTLTFLRNRFIAFRLLCFSIFPFSLSLSLYIYIYIDRDSERGKEREREKEGKRKESERKKERERERWSVFNTKFLLSP